jgi:formate hydrogenlyase subunit 3/multisubunit Na+/H+ antiporter MnhD subunit
MTAPLIWIVFPALAGLLLYVLRQWYRVSAASGATLAALLAILAWFVPFEQEITLGSLVFEVPSTWVVLGRQFLLADSDRVLLTTVYGLSAFWFFGAYPARAGRRFVPLGLIITALLTASLAVRPFLFAGLLLAITALVYALLLTTPGQAVGRGILRFLTFTLLGTPFILFAGWILAGFEAMPADPEDAIRVASLLGFGLALLMGIFPFHTWIPPLMEEAHPYPATFVLVILPWMVSFFGLEFLERYIWLNSSANLPVILRIGGLVMVVVSGVWVAFERHLGRQLGFAAMLETGHILLALSLPLGNLLHLQMIIPRVVSLGVWALALSRLQRESPGQWFRDMHGRGRGLPAATLALVLAQLSVAGLPILAGFPLRLAIWDGLARDTLAFAVLALASSAGVITAALRTLTVLVTGPEESGWVVQESPAMLALLLLAVVSLLIVGILPQWLLPWIAAGI